MNEMAANLIFFYSIDKNILILLIKSYCNTYRLAHHSAHYQRIKKSKPWNFPQSTHKKWVLELENIYANSQGRIILN